jgi:hypothetical protein
MEASRSGVTGAVDRPRRRFTTRLTRGGGCLQHRDRAIDIPAKVAALTALVRDRPSPKLGRARLLERLVPRDRDIP